jgi:predicted Na+-dependent transporter
MLRLLILGISVATAISGAIQLLAPHFVLNLISGDQSAANLHTFGIVGMFMLLFGCLMTHALYDNSDNRVAIFWSGMQKIGAFIAISIGIYKGLFAMIALAVAGFDLFSGMLFLYYYVKLGKDSKRK